MAYDIHDFAKLGLLHELIPGIDADMPAPAHVARVKERLAAAIAEIRQRPGDLTSRLNNPAAQCKCRLDRGTPETGGAMERIVGTV